MIEAESESAMHHHADAIASAIRAAVTGLREHGYSWADIGSRLGVTEDTDLAQLDPSDPESAGKAAYAWLTYLQGELIETLLGDLPG